MQPGDKGVADFADFVLLQAINRYEPLLAHFAADAGQLHPEDFYRRAIEIAGEIATFASRTKRATQFPPYRHDDLEHSFAPVIADLRQLLSAVLDQNAVRIPLQQRPYGIRVAVIQDRDLIAFASFVLAARAEMPIESLQRTFPQHVKIGPVEQIASSWIRRCRGSPCARSRWCPGSCHTRPAPATSSSTARGRSGGNRSDPADRRPGDLCRPRNSPRSISNLWAIKG